MSYYTTVIMTAVSEKGGCFAFWSWLRLDKSVWWVLPRTVFWSFLPISSHESILVLRVEHLQHTVGLYIATSLVWLWIVERQIPDRWDIIGAAICIGGSSVILFGPRE